MKNTGFIHSLIEQYLRLRLKGAYALRPPLGWYSVYYTPPFYKRVSYYFKYWFWRFEHRLWKNHGDTLRKEWEVKVGIDIEEANKWVYNFLLGSCKKDCPTESVSKKDAVLETCLCRDRCFLNYFSIMWIICKGCKNSLDD